MSNIIKAKHGKTFRRIADSIVYGDEITLGYTYFINGELLNEPHLDTIEDFEEIDITEDKIIEVSI